MSYLKINGISFDSDVAILQYSRTYNVLDGENAGRLMSGRMTRDVIGTYVTYKMTFSRRADNYSGLDTLFDYLKQHSVDDFVTLEVADGQGTITFEAYYTSFPQELQQATDGVNWWDQFEVSFISMDAVVTP